MTMPPGTGFLDARPTRRELLRRAGRLTLGLGLGLAAPPLLAGCSPTIRLGIVAGTQTLWRAIAHQKDELLGALGYNVSFNVFPTEAALRDAFLARQLDVIATLPPLTPALAEAGADVQFFLPIAWIREGYPLVVPSDAPVRQVPDLVGKRVAIFPLNHPGVAYWRAFAFKHYGFRIEDRLALREDDDPASLLLGGQVDAGIVDSMVWASLKPLGQFRVISDLATEWRAISQRTRLLMYGGYLARREWLQAQRRFVADFVKVNVTTFQRYQRDPDAVVAAAVAYRGEHVPSLDRATNLAIAHYLGYDDVPPERMAITADDLADYTVVFQLLADCGYLAAPPRDVRALFLLSAPA